MNIATAVTRFGTDAVLKYRDLAVIKEDETRIPEACLSLSIASSLITGCNLDARVEVPYSRILNELGLQGTDIAAKFGGQRADIATYDEGKPSAIIEIKIIDEVRRPSGVVNDWKKIAPLQSYLASKGLPMLRGYVGALVCDVTNRPAESTVQELSKSLGLDLSVVDRGVTQKALQGRWEWLFVCAKLT